MVALSAISRRKGQYGVGLSSREWSDGEPRYVRITDINEDGRLNGMKVAPDGAQSDWDKAILNPGDLLFARSGATVGKTYLHTDDNDPAVYAGYLIRFQLDHDLALPEYVFRYTQSAAYRRWVANSQRAVAQPNINSQQYGELPIPLPPLEEQRRITAILDHADALRAKRREALARLDELTQSIFIDMFGDSRTISTLWPAMSLKDAFTAIESGRSPTCHTRAAADDEYGVLKLGAVTYGVYDPSQNKALPEDVVPDVRHEVRPGDLLFTRKNTAELVGATALVRHTRAKLLLPDLVFRLKVDPTSAMNAAYLQAVMMYPPIRRGIQGLAGGSAGSMPNISKAKLLTVKLPHPPLDLQLEFEQRVNCIESLKESQYAALAELDALFASLQSRAFRGEL